MYGAHRGSKPIPKLHFNSAIAINSWELMMQAELCLDKSATTWNYINQRFLFVVEVDKVPFSSKRMEDLTDDGCKLPIAMLAYSVSEDQSNGSASPSIIVTQSATRVHDELTRGAESWGSNMEGPWQLHTLQEKMLVIIEATAMLLHLSPTATTT